jgi:hypothetical protein
MIVPPVKKANKMVFYWFMLKLFVFHYNPNPEADGNVIRDDVDLHRFRVYFLY